MSNVDIDLARKMEIADFFAASSPPQSAFLSLSVSSNSSLSLPPIIDLPSVEFLVLWPGSIAIRRCLFSLPNTEQRSLFLQKSPPIRPHPEKMPGKHRSLSLSLSALLVIGGLISSPEGHECHTRSSGWTGKSISKQSFERFSISCCLDEESEMASGHSFSIETSGHHE